MSKINILYIIDYLSIGGGTENQLRKTIQHLDKSKFNVSVAVLKYLDWEGFPEYADPGCPHICLHVEKLLSFNTVKKIFTLAKHIRKNNIDIVHTFFFDANLIGVAAGVLSGRKNIFISRRDLGFWYTKPKLWLLRFLRTFSKRYVVNSQAIKRAVMTHEKVADDKIDVIYNGFFTFPDNNPSPVSKSSLGIPEHAFVVGIVANLREVKRLDLFIKLAEKLNNGKNYFLMMGNGPLKETLLRQAEQAGLKDCFQIQHTLDDIFDYVKLFDIGVLTSSSEGLSNTLIEYQLCEKPAVAFDVGGNNEVIVPGKTGEVAPFGDVDTMVNYISELADNQTKRINYGRAARSHAENLFGGDRMIRTLEAVYESTCRPANPAVD